MNKSLGCAYAPGVPDRRKTTRQQRSPWLLPDVVHIAACSTRAEAWDSVVAIHSGKRQVTSWNFAKATRGQHWFDPLKFHGCDGEANRLYKNIVATVSTSSVPVPLTFWLLLLLHITSNRVMKRLQNQKRCSVFNNV